MFKLLFSWIIINKNNSEILVPTLVQMLEVLGLYNAIYLTTLLFFIFISKFMECDKKVCTSDYKIYYDILYFSKIIFLIIIIILGMDI